MKRLLLILILTLSFLSLSKADDITDFQIEGMSIGDSALNFFSKNQIIKNSRKYYNNKKFTPVQTDNLSFFKIYDGVDFNFRTGDNKYIIQSISGIILTKNVNDCIDKQNVIKNELALIFPNAVRTNKDNVYNDNIWKGTRNTQFSFFLDNNAGSAAVHCYDYSKEHGGQDHLSVNLKTKKFNYFLLNEAYK
tara:strand:- start:112 stop:687 length:576 start_codon:yes stop_codon:yes gene_type:complete